MKTRAAVGGAVLIMVAMAGVWAGAAGLPEDRKSVFGFKGLVEVRELVVSYEPGEPVKVVAHLASGVTVDDVVKDSDTVDRLIQISQAFASPRARLAVTLREDRIVSYHLATGAGR